MKQILLATSVLALTAGAAAAEITLKGTAEMGIAGGDFYGDANDNAQFWQSYEIIVDATGETDTGLSFGMHLELENETNFDSNTIAVDNERVFISGAFGTLTLGEQDGAYDKVMPGMALAGGTIADDETVHAGYNGHDGLGGTLGLAGHDAYGDNQILRYDYTFGDIGFSASYEQVGDGGKVELDLDGDGDDDKLDDIISVGVTYKGDFAGTGIGLALGYQTGANGVRVDRTAGTVYRDNGDTIGASITGDFGNGLQAGIEYSKFDFDNSDDLDGSHVGVGLAYTTGAITVAANYGKYEFDGADDVDGWALLANYDLGGGAVVQAGYADSDFGDFGGADGSDAESYSLGVALKF